MNTKQTVSIKTKHTVMITKQPLTQPQRTFLQLPLLLLLAMFLVAATASAATRYSVATGNWNSTATWSATSGGASGASVPVAGDAVIIEGADNVTVNVANAACTSVVLGSPTGGGGAGTLTFASGSQLTVSGTVTIGQSAVRTGSIIMTSGGLLQCGSTVTVNNLGTFTAGTGTIEYNGAAQTVATGLGAYNNLTLRGSGAKTTTGVTVNGTLSMQGTATASGTSPTYGASAALAIQRQRGPDCVHR